MNTIQTYRADIDGLRAVAVLSVVFYHFGIGAFPGGFIGVDVFFVISGFLISSIIYREMQAGEFSFARFYQRRIRRIVPALAVVIIASAVAAYVLLLPSHFENFGYSALYSSLGLANIYFFFNTGYFDQAAEELPLLHIWSLAIEEQFYVFWPIVLLVLAWLSQRLRRNAVIALGLIILVSFTWSEFTVTRNPEAAFFLPHLRAWELALGALLAFMPAIASKRLCELMAVVGLGLIVYGVVMLSADSVFPGHNALYPCIGAALIVWPKAHATYVSRLLSVRPAVGIGLISYSLYLWHWPILVFFRYWNNGEAPAGWEIVALLTASLVISVLSWRFVEQPFRRPGARFSLPWPTALAGLGVAAVAGGSVALASGMPGRLSAELQMTEKYLDYTQPDVSDVSCRIRQSGNDWRDPDSACLSGLDGRPRVLVMGDSHANHYVAALVERFPSIHFSYLGNSRCRPVLNPEGRENCVEVIVRGYSEVIPEGEFDAVIVSARWRNGHHEQIGESVAYLLRHVPTVIVFGQTLEYGGRLPELLLNDVLPRRNSLTPRRMSRASSLRPINTELRELAEAAGAEFYDPLDVFCRGDSCVTLADNGVPFQWDYGHLTKEGALYVLERFVEQGLFANFPARMVVASPAAASE